MLLVQGGSPDDTARSFYDFFKTRYPGTHTPYADDPLPYAMAEEYVDTTKIDSGRQWLRVLVNPFMHLPYCLVLERKAGRAVLTMKIADGKGRYFTGQLFLTKRTILNDSELGMIFGRLDSLDFWNARDDTPCVCTDGSGFYFEAMLDGRYHRVNRSSIDESSNVISRALYRIQEALEDSVHFDVYYEPAETEVLARYGIFRGRRR